MIETIEASTSMVYFFGLKDTTPTNALIFNNVEIIFFLLIAIIIFQEKIRKNEFAPFLMIVIGIIISSVTYDLYKNDPNMFSLLLEYISIILS